MIDHRKKNQNQNKKKLKYYLKKSICFGPEQVLGK
jgi:hypothetical protein